MVASKEYRVIGTRPIRPDGTDKVTGKAQYGADVHLTNMLFGRIKRSPYAHARIKRIDTSKAEALPGVKAVVTAADFPLPSETFATVFEGLMNVRSAQENFLAKDKVLYVGHARRRCLRRRRPHRRGRRRPDRGRVRGPAAGPGRARGHAGRRAHRAAATCARAAKSSPKAPAPPRPTWRCTASGRPATSRRASPKPTSSSSVSTPRP